MPGEYSSNIGALPKTQIHKMCIHKSAKKIDPAKTINRSCTCLTAPAIYTPSKCVTHVEICRTAPTRRTNLKMCIHKFN